MKFFCFPECLLTDMIGNHCDLRDLACLDSAICHKADRPVLLRVLARLTRSHKELPQDFSVEAAEWMHMRGIRVDELHMDVVLDMFQQNNNCFKWLQPSAIRAMHFRCNNAKNQHKFSDELLLAFNRELTSLINKCTGLCSMTNSNIHHVRRMVNVCGASLRDVEVDVDFRECYFVEFNAMASTLRLNSLIIHKAAALFDKNTVLESLCSLLKRQRKLKTFVMRQGGWTAQQTLQLVEMLAKFCPCLEAVEIGERDRMMTCTNWSLMPSFFPRLRSLWHDELNPINITWYNYQYIVEMFQHCPALKPEGGFGIYNADSTLSEQLACITSAVDTITLCGGLDDFNLRLMKAFPLVKQLILIHNTLPTATTVAMLCSLQHLRHLTWSTHWNSYFFQQFSMHPSLHLHTLKLFLTDTDVEARHLFVLLIRACGQNSLKRLELKIHGSCWHVYASIFAWIAEAKVVSKMYPEISIQLWIPTHLSCCGDCVVDLLAGKESITLGWSINELVRGFHMEGFHVTELECSRDSTLNQTHSNSVINFFKLHPELQRVTVYAASHKLMIELLLEHSPAFQPRAERQKTGARRGVLRLIDGGCSLSRELKQELLRRRLTPKIDVD